MSDFTPQCMGLRCSLIRKVLKSDWKKNFTVKVIIFMFSNNFKANQVILNLMATLNNLFVLIWNIARFILNLRYK